MPDIYFDANHISPFEIKQHEALIKDILAGALRSPQVKRLQGAQYQGQPVYRAKIDEQYRLIYSYLPYANEKRLLLLAVNNHNYKKLKRQFSAPSTQHLESIELEDGEQHQGNTSATGALTTHPTISYKDKTLILNQDQKQARQHQEKHQKDPLILLGPPGAGKTCTLYAMMMHHLSEQKDQQDENTGGAVARKVLFLSPSEHLISDHKTLYQTENSEAPDAVVFTTWGNLLQSHYPKYSAASPTLFSPIKCSR